MPAAQKMVPSGVVANVMLEGDDNAEGREVLKDMIWDESTIGTRRREGGYVWFTPHLEAFDPSDPDDGPLYIMYAAEDGSAATLFSPDSIGVEEMERRLHRCGLGDGTIDDFDVAVGPVDFRLTADDKKALLALISNALEGDEFTERDRDHYKAIALKLSQPGRVSTPTGGE